MFKHFSGRIIQVANELCAKGSVSNQIINMHKLFLELGLNACISTLYSHQFDDIETVPLDELAATTSDIIFFHHWGYSSALENVLKQRCCKIYVYHNITPPEFFESNIALSDFCKKGLVQLPDVIGQFDFYLGDSTFNLESLFHLGLNKKQSMVFPIIIDRPASPLKTHNPPRKKKWLFVGRIVENKQQLQLVEFFHRFITHYNCDDQLFLIGDHNQDPEYTKKIINLINQVNLNDRVKLLGLVNDKELDKMYAKADLYVSLSKHEGFGIPLIEACHYNIPVFALNYGAVAEVLQGSCGTANTEYELAAKIANYFDDAGNKFQQQILIEQEKLKNYYRMCFAKQRMQPLLEKFIPTVSQFKTVSIIICTYNRADFLARCLDYLQYQTNPNFEIIVVNGVSTDHTMDVINQYKDSIKFAQNTIVNLAVSRNLGIALASGDIIAFVDDDAIPFDNWVEIILRTFNQIPLQTAALGGPVYYAGTFEFQSWDALIDRFANVSHFSSISSHLDSTKYRYAHGTNAVFKREDLLAIGGFDEEYDFSYEEADLCVRLQLDLHKLIHFEKDLYMRHEFAQSENRINKYNCNWFSICKNKAYFSIKFNSHLSHAEHLERITKQFNLRFYEPINSAFSLKEISYEEKSRYFESITKGMQQGIKDAQHPQKIANFSSETPPPFKVYNSLKNIHEIPSTTSAFETSNKEYSADKTVGGISRAFLHNSLLKPTPRRHIVILTEGFGHLWPGGGIGTLYYQLASELLQMGNRVSVVIPANNTSSEFIRGDFALYVINTSSHLLESAHVNFIQTLNQSITVTRFIQQLHVKQPIDIIEYALWNTLGLMLSANPILQSVTRVLRLVTPFKFIAEFNNLPITAEELKLKSDAEKYLIATASIIVPISQSIEKTILENHQIVKDNRWKFCSAGVAYWPTFDVNSGYKTLNIDDAKFTNISSHTKKILFIGRLESRKGIEILFAAIQLYFKKEPNADVVFIIAGKDTGQFQENFLQTTTQPIIDKVIFLGEIKEVVKEKLFAFCDFVVFPSLYESFGLVPLEAFVHSKPVIGANAGAIPEVIQDHKSGLLFQPGNADALVNAINLLIRDQILYETLAKGALQRVKELSSRNMALKTIKIYNDALNTEMSQSAMEILS